MKKVPVIGYREMNNYPGYKIINTTSRSEDSWSKQLSPFFLGPVELYDDYTADNVENAWQFSKVYPEHVSIDNTVTGAYYAWAEKGWSSTRAERYPMGKGRTPLFSLWDGNRLSYLEARKRIYAPLYSQAVVQTKAWEKLKKMYTRGDEFVLLDFDGYDYLKEGLTLKQVMDNPKRKMGHAFVLAMLLQFPELEERYK
jgi:hypothetical protein